MYEKYDEYNAINIDKCADIPWQYDGLYEIIDLLKGNKTKINGKAKYARIIIRSNLASAFIINRTINVIPLSERNN